MLSDRVGPARIALLSALTSLALILGLLLVVAPHSGCSGGEPGGGNPGGAALTFHGEQQALPDFSHDTGYLPEGSPLQVQLVLAATGKLSVDAGANPGGGSAAPTLTGVAGSGRFVLDVRITFQVNLKVDISAPFGQGLQYEGPLMNVPSIDLAFGADVTFDPFLVGAEAKLEAQVPETDLATIPLAGAVPIPGVEGNLILAVGGTVRSAFSGTCAVVTAGEASYMGVTRTSGTLLIKPRVEISLGPLSQSVGPFDVPVEIPALEAPLDLGRKPVTGGGPGGGGGSEAAVGSCDPSASPGADGGPGGDRGPNADGPLRADGVTIGADGGASDGSASSDGPGRDQAGGAGVAGRRCDGSATDPCPQDQCLSVAGGSLTAGVCFPPCATDADCGDGGTCFESQCLQGCTAGQNDPCGPGTSCDVANLICVPSCGSDQDCENVEAGITDRYCNTSLGLCLNRGTPGAAVGGPCTGNLDCPQNGFCVDEASGYPGGYCIIIGCEYGDVQCDGGSLCALIGEEGQTGCVRSCSSATDCREGYDCQGDPAGGASVCAPPA